MFKFRQIAALFLLGSFSIMLVHSALPHVHHFHDLPDGKAIAAEHDHHSDENLFHHHSHSEDDKSESRVQNSLLSFLADSHSHLFHIHEFVQFTKRDTQLVKDKVMPCVANVKILYSFQDILNRRTSRYLHSQDHWFDDPFLLNCSVRAPPQLG